MAPLTKKIYPINTDLNADQDIDGLLSGVAWNLTTITYSYPNSSSDYGSRYGSNEPKTGFKALNADQRAAADYAIDQFDSVTTLSFQNIGSENDKDAIIRYAESNKPSTAWAYYPSERPEGGDVWFNNAKHYYDNPKAGNYAWFTFLHETGHALGLKHPHEQSNTFGVVDAAHDSMEYTVMSYRSYVGDSLSGGYANETWGFPQTLMMNDIAALQYMYGADFTFHAGDTVYTWSPTWSPTTSQLSITDGLVVESGPLSGANRIFMTVWDGGGIDTYDFSGYTTNLLVDLQPGNWTKTDTVNNYQTAHLDYYEGNTHLAAGNIANALTYKTYSSGLVTSENLGSLIENAIGGSGNDTFMGNVLANSFTGGAGEDTFAFSGPGAGIDHVLDFNGDAGDRVSTNGQAATVTETTDTHWVEIQFGSDAIILDHVLYTSWNSSWLIA